jgi:tRNA 2-selenouridine synthase
MAVTRLSIEEFLVLAKQHPVIDVRSPAEFAHAHIPGAFSLPLFNDEERAIVGTAYKKQGKQKAIKLGLDFFGVKMRQMVETVEMEIVTAWLSRIHDRNVEKKGSNKTVLVHCWRGGMRSAGVAWLLDLYGFEVYTLQGGYKAYRNWVLWQFSKSYDFKIIGGYTGSGKTELLHEMAKKGEHVIDLEGIANHKGSAFGGIGQEPQPKQEMFENILAHKLDDQKGNTFWLEDESQRIGILNIPHNFWNTMRTKPVYFLDIPFEERLEFIHKGYGKGEKEKLVNAIIRIQKRLGPLETKTAIGHLLEDDYKAAFSILLHYYDKTYTKSLANRENLSQLLNKIPASSVDSITNLQKIYACLAAQPSSPSFS